MSRDGLDLGDVRPGDEILPGPREDHRFDGAVTRGLHEGVRHLPHEVLGELVHRRVVHIQDGHAFLHFHFQCLVIGFHRLTSPKDKSQIPNINV